MSNRTSFLRYRFGTGTEEAILPAWLTIYGASMGAAETVINRIIQPVTGFVDCGRNIDVEVGDVLREGKAGSMGRVFLVSQIEQRPATKRLLVTEIGSPIPDEFESGVREAFWSEDGTWVVDKSLGAAQPTPLPSLSNPGVNSFLYQTIVGDFDCYVQVSVDTGSGGAIRYGMLKAQENLLGPDLVAIGLRDNGSPTLFRFDRVDPTLTTTDETTVPGGQYVYLRLQRIGKRFRTFWALLDQQPEKESQWRELFAPTAGSWTTANQLLIGVAGHQNAGTNGTVLFHFLKNWRVK